MKIAFIASECLPFVKTGGLADVGLGLTQSLANMGHDVVVYMPKYGEVEADFITNYEVRCGDNCYYAGIFETKVKNVVYRFIDNEVFFKRASSSYYGHGDDGLRFGFFARAVLDSFGVLDDFCDICHCNDWHTGLVSYILNTEHRLDPKYQNIKLFLTLHNLEFQGNFDKSLVHSLGLKESDDLYFNDQINFLKTGILNSYKINTVSPSYKQRTLNGYGHGLESILNYKSADYLGILNGIDVDFFTAKHSKLISPNFGQNDFVQAKLSHKIKLCQKYHLDSSLPLYIIVSRITKQKGFDVLLKTLDRFLVQDVNLFVLGDGDFGLVHGFEQYCHLPNFKIHVGYDEKLAHQLYAAGDFLIMPSRFEPCGLSQMIAMGFGCVPIVNDVDGLHDSVTSYNEFDFTGNGLKIDYLNTANLAAVLNYSVFLAYNHNHLETIQTNCLATDFNFNNVALEYEKMYLS